MERYVPLSSVLICNNFICSREQPPVGDIIQMNQALVKDLQDTYLNGALEEKISIDEVIVYFLTKVCDFKEHCFHFVAGRELK
jgi:hypothetical protein